MPPRAQFPSSSSSMIQSVESDNQENNDPALTRNLSPDDGPPQPNAFREGTAEHFVHVILKNKYNEIYPNNPNGFVTIDMWIHNQTSTKYVELREFGVYRSMSDLELWHSLILHYGRIVYRQLMSMDVPQSFQVNEDLSVA